MMIKLMNLLKRLRQEESGQDLTEYALVVALIAFRRRRRHEYPGERPQRTPSAASPARWRSICRSPERDAAIRLRAIRPKRVAAGSLLKPC